MGVAKSEQDLKSVMQNLLREAPKSKAGRVTWLWAEISEALGRGHGVKTIWEHLQANGLEMKYNEFRSYVSRMKKKRPQSEKGRESALVPIPTADRARQQPSPLSSLDESEARTREHLQKGRSFEWKGTKDEDPDKLF
jgi:hypothetical protein